MQGRRGELVERTLQGRSAGGRIAAANRRIEGMAEKDAAAGGVEAPGGAAKPRDPRADRLAAQLRANLKRRKEQAKARSAGEDEPG